MFDLISANPLAFVLALVIGIATGWWIWGRREEAVEEYYEEEAEPEAGAEAVAPLAAAAVIEDNGPAIAPAVGDSDDLTRISGIGPKLNELCQSLGVRRFDQIAAWTDDDIAEVDQYLLIKGRITRDEWVPQAQLLAAGNVDEWEERYGARRPRIAPAVGPDEDLTMINGIGPKLAEMCNALGVRRFDQIAAWSADDVAEVDAHLDGFSGRIGRDQWVEQAKLLARGELQQWKGQFGYKSERD